MLCLWDIREMSELLLPKMKTIETYYKFLLIQFWDRLPTPNLVVHEWLGKCRLIKLIVTPVLGDWVRYARIHDFDPAHQRRYVMRSTMMS